jgi:hypothetical protein
MTPLITLGCFVDLFGFIGVVVEVATNYANQLLYPFLMIVIFLFQKWLSKSKILDSEHVWTDFLSTLFETR